MNELADEPVPAVGVASAHARSEDDLSLPGDGAQPSALDSGEILVSVHAYGAGRVEHALVSQVFPRLAPYTRAMDAAGTVIAIGDGVTRFAVGDEVFGHFPAASCTWVEAPCARTPADGAHIELRPDALEQHAAAALAEGGLTAKTILRAAELRPGLSALVIGATSGIGTVLVPLLAESGVHVIAAATPEDDAYVRSLGAAETIRYATADPIGDALAHHPGVDLLVDLVSFDEPYFITAAATRGTIVTAIPAPEVDDAAGEFGIPRIRISAEPGDLTALVQRAIAAGPCQLPAPPPESPQLSWPAG